MRIPCMPLRHVTDGPLMLAPPGTLSELQNMRLRPGGYAEMRGGLEKLKPSGGTSANAISEGGINAGIQISTSYGWIRTFGVTGTTWTENYQFHEGNWLPFPVGDVNDALYFGCDAPFGRIAAKVELDRVWNLTLVYEYWNGASWGSLSTKETFTFTSTLGSTVDNFASWYIPSDWAQTVTGNTTKGNILKYWMRIRISAKVSLTTMPQISRAYGLWIGMRELYLLSQSPHIGDGRLLRYDQSAVAGTAQYFQVNGSAMYASTDAPPSVAAFRGRIFGTNPKETFRWDGRIFQNVGLVKLPVGSGNPGTSRAVGAGLGAGIWRHYIAFGYGPPLGENQVHPVDILPMYGAAQAVLCVPTANADPNDANSLQTTAGNEVAVISWAAVTIPADASTIHFYHTQDLTNVPVSKRASFPAFLIDSYNRRLFTTGTTYNDTGTQLFPPIEAILYDNTPPQGSRFCFVFENRLFLGGGPDGRWYWSKPFYPDQWDKSFDYIDTVRALGGRPMGGIEYANQAVLYTEDQTWGLKDVDLPVPNLYPIHPGVGCVAPPSAAVGDGWLIWMAKDGFYAWNGSPEGPRNVSGNYKQTFAHMNFKAHGGSHGVIHDHKYIVALCPADQTTLGTQYSLDLESWEWSVDGSSVLSGGQGPLCLIHAPLGHADEGIPHPLYAHTALGTSGASNPTSPMIGGYTTQDDGGGFTCAATFHFPLAPGETFSPSRVVAYYNAPNGWGSPTLSTSGTEIGGDVGTITTGTADVGTDYTVLGGTYSQQGAGSSDLKVRFAVANAAGGTVGRQRLFGAIIEGELAGLREGGI